MRVFNSGVLLTGPAGAGKSSLALGLMDRGHALFADDLVRLERCKQSLIATRQAAPQILALRDIGLITPSRVTAQNTLNMDLIIQLDPAFHPNRSVTQDAQRRLHGAVLAFDFAGLTPPGYAVAARQDLLLSCLYIEQLVKRLGD